MTRLHMPQNLWKFVVCRRPSRDAFRPNVTKKIIFNDGIVLEVLHKHTLNFSELPIDIVRVGLFEGLHEIELILADL